MSVMRCSIDDLSAIGIPSSVEKLGGKCFSKFKRLANVRFGDSSSWKCIPTAAFSVAGPSEIHLPDRVEKLCDGCFGWCISLVCATFGESSSLKRIADHVFFKYGLREIYIPKVFKNLVMIEVRRCQ